MTFFGFRTIRDGERAAVWSLNGKVRVVDGPKRITLVRQKLERMPSYFANESQYLEVRKREGPVVIMPGPCSLVKDPITDASINVQEATFIDASEALVVYRRKPCPDEIDETCARLKGEGVQRRVVHGPARFVPDATEWVHTFSWTGVPANGSKTTYQPNANKFTKLSVIPSQIYHNVNEVRTSDDTLITVKLMIFFELKTIERMLDSTADPISDFINAASADVVAFCATRTYEQFTSSSAELNALSSFAQLTQRAAICGYTISKVVFRGFQAGDKLQAMHDGAIQERTRLRLKEETQEQEQRAADLKLAAEQARAEKQAELELGQARLKAELALSAKRAALEQERLEDEARRAQEKARHEARLAEQRELDTAALERDKQRLELERQRNAEQLRALGAMNEMGVDVTKVLVSQHEHPDRVIRLDTGASRDAKADGSGQGLVGGLLGGLQLHL